MVYTILENCREWKAPEPIIVTESGRALTAHHAMIVIPVIDTIGPTREVVQLPPLQGEIHAVLRDMQDLLKDVHAKNYRESYNEAIGNKDTMHSLFDLGYISLLERAHFEQFFNRLLMKVAKIVEDFDYAPEELEDLPKTLADKYVCNFSLFQSLP